MSAEGWALWVTGGSPHLRLTACGGTWRLATPFGAEPPASGLLLGRLGGVFGVLRRLALACRQRSGEFRRGKRMRPACESGVKAGRAAAARGSLLTRRPPAQ